MHMYIYAIEKDDIPKTEGSIKTKLIITETDSLIPNKTKKN